MNFKYNFKDDSPTLSYARRNVIFNFSFTSHHTKNDFFDSDFFDFWGSEILTFMQGYKTEKSRKSRFFEAPK